MVMVADLEIPTKVILQQLASALKLVVQVSRLQDGSIRRKLLDRFWVSGINLPESVFAETLSVNS